MDWSWFSENATMLIVVTISLLVTFLVIRFLTKKKVFLLSCFLFLFASILVSVGCGVYRLLVSDSFNSPISYFFVVLSGVLACCLVGLTFFHFFLCRGEPLTVYGVSRLGTHHRFRSGWFLGLFFLDLEKIWRTIELARTSVDGETKPEVANSTTLPMQWNLDYQADNSTQKKLENFCRETSKENRDEAIQDAVNNIISELVQNKTVDEVKNDRAELNKQILEGFLKRPAATGEALPEYFGIRVLKFELEDVEIPEEIEKAKQAIAVAEAKKQVQEQENQRFKSEMKNLRESAKDLQETLGVSGKEALLAAQRQIGKVTTQEEIKTFDGGSNLIGILPEIAKIFKGSVKENSSGSGDVDCLIVHPDGRRELRGREAREESQRTLKGGKNAGN